MNPYKEMLIDAIVGAGFGSIEAAMLAERRGHASYTGNQYNPEWQWNREALRQFSDQGLQELYQGIKEYQFTQMEHDKKEELKPTIIISNTELVGE